MADQVYVLRLGDTDYFKVGVTQDMVKRLASLQTGSPFELSVVRLYETDAAYKLEQDVHSLLKAYRVRNEWFFCDLSVITHVFSVAETMHMVDSVLDLPVLESSIEIPETSQKDRDELIIKCIQAGMNRAQIREHLSAQGFKVKNDYITHLRARCATVVFEEEDEAIQ